MGGRYHVSRFHRILSGSANKGLTSCKALSGAGSVLLCTRYRVHLCTRYRVLSCTRYRVLLCTRYRVLLCTRYRVLLCTRYRVLLCTRYRVHLSTRYRAPFAAEKSRADWAAASRENEGKSWRKTRPTAQICKPAQQRFLLVKKSILSDLQFIWNLMAVARTALPRLANP